MSRLFKKVSISIGVLSVVTRLTAMAPDTTDISHYLDEVKKCNEHATITIPADVLKKDPENFFNAATTCRNARHILAKFDQAIKQQNPRETFSHHYNRVANQRSASPRNYFLEKLVEKGKY
jgi:hypothetical protein